MIERHTQMTRINTNQVESIARVLEQSPDATISLEDLCDILKLSLKDDSEIIFEILSDNIFFLNNKVSQFAWTTNKEGFKILTKYAYYKQIYLTIFHELFMSNFRKQKRNNHKTQQQEQEHNHDH